MAKMPGSPSRTIPLFEGLRGPTTRDVALRVQEGGIDALTEAIRRADAARYQEVRCRSALNHVKGMPFTWTLNPYRGCTHGCHYCYARRYHAQFELDADDAFASVILVKTNLVEVLRRELAKPEWQREPVAFGTATDCYQPIEGHYKLTRRALQACLDFATPVSIVTKGPLVVRDIDILVRLSKVVRCAVYMSVPCVDEEVWRKLEPGTAHPLQRLRAVRLLHEAGVSTSVLMAPIVPGISSRPALLERTVAAAAAHGARTVGCAVMHLEDGARTHFLKWLAVEYPHLLDGYAELYAHRYVPTPYRDAVRRVMARLTTKHGLIVPASRQRRRDAS